MEDEIKVNGTLIWYYMICKREVWMMARQITADQDDDNMGIGRYLHEHRYNREKKEIEVGNGKMDFVQRKDGHLIASEMKKAISYKVQPCNYSITLTRCQKGELMQSVKYAYPSRK